MSDFDLLEKELGALSPRPPTKEFTQRIDEALGEAGSVAMCHPNLKTNQLSNPAPRSRIVKWTFSSLGLTASVTLIFFLMFPGIENNFSKDTQFFADKPLSTVEDNDSPLHGVTSDQLEDSSGIPSIGWLDPYTEEKFIRRVDEGIVDRVTGLPARQYRYHFVDETLWTHPASETRVLSTTPRQEVYLIDLELY